MDVSFCFSVLCYFSSYGFRSFPINIMHPYFMQPKIFLDKSTEFSVIPIFVNCFPLFRFLKSDYLTANSQKCNCVSAKHVVYYFLHYIVSAAVLWYNTILHEAIVLTATKRRDCDGSFQTGFRLSAHRRSAGGD